MRRLIDRVFGLIALALARGFHRRFETDGLEGLRQAGPRLVVVNHFNGFMDVVVLIAALGRLPRFVGKATLHDVVVARPFLRLAGVVLVQRRVDGRGTEANSAAFARCHERLARGECVVIFPEGTTHDRETLAEVRTGAARIATSALDAGVEGLRLVPVGLTYGDKTRVRNDVLVVAGPSIGVPRDASDDHEAVRSLTDAIGAGIEALVPGTDDPIVAWTHQLAATICCRTGAHEPRLAEVLDLARTTIASPAARRDAVERAVADYELALAVAAIDDRSVIGRPRPLLPDVVRGVVTWLALPVLGSLALTNAPAVALVMLVDRFVRVPVTKGTVRALVAAVAFPATWIVVAAGLVDGFARILAVVVAQAVALPVALWLVEHDVAAVRALLARHRAAQATARVPALAHRRAALVAAVAAAGTPTQR